VVATPASRLSMAEQSESRDVRTKPKGFIGKTLALLFKSTGILILSLILSILIEWVGLFFFWPDEGTEHSRKMLEVELNYLNEDFRQSLITSSLAKLAESYADALYYYLFEWTGLVDFIHWAQQPNQPGDGKMVHASRRFMQSMADYFIAAIQITEVFAVRLAVLTLSLPVFFLFALIGMVEGLMQRDLRRWGGGRESSFLYHHAKRIITPVFVAPWIIYLGMPTSIHPNWIILPFAALTGTAIMVSFSSFKKYL